MRRCVNTTLLIVLLGVLPGSPARPLAAQEGLTQERTATFNFQDADLAFVLSALAQAAGIGFTYADLPQKPVTLRATLTTTEMLSLIHSIAGANGISVAAADGVLRLQGSNLPIEDPRQLFIHRLQHARAPVLASTLQALFSGGAITRFGGGTAQTLSAQLRQLGNQQAQQPAQIVMAGGASEPFGAVVVPDDATNSLLVRASPGDWAVMQAAIQALDTRPLQVVIEVVIAEVRRTDDTNIGVSFTADGSEGEQNTIGDLPTARETENDFTLRILRSGDIDVEATLSALAASGRVRILSRPVIAAQNNLEARINVGTERPFVQISRSLGTTEPFRDEVIQYRDVGTVLTILPTINEDGYVNMAVTQEINSATNEVQFGAPIISTREASTHLLARDGQTVVIGGLIDTQTDYSRAGIPLLMDIPVLGALFSTTRENVGNSELFLFLTPHIVYSDEDADRVKEEIERNAELLEPLTPIVPLITPNPRIIQLDTLRTDTIRSDTIRSDTIRSDTTTVRR
ncbi:MAG: secretin N-terminal domain-containing protein [Gemmatimonadota bacterium]